MPKIKSQTKDIIIKKEKHRYECENIWVLQSVRIIAKDRNKITKRSPRNNNALPLCESKVEPDEIDTKSSLLELKTQEDIEQSQRIPATRLCTQEQVKTLIRHLVQDKMTVKEASHKANMSPTAGLRYYRKYMEDPNHDIPIPYSCANRPPKKCTQAQINSLIGYMVDDKMTLATAASKAGMGGRTGRIYYELYMNHPNHVIPTPRISVPRGKPCTEEQIKEFIRYMVDDRMTITAASDKAKIARDTGSKYYHKYLKDPNCELALPKQGVYRSKCCTQEQVRDLVGYIVDDNMSIRSASAKAGMSEKTGRRYYKRYLDDPNHEIPVPLKYATNSEKTIKEET